MEIEVKGHAYTLTWPMEINTKQSFGFACCCGSKKSIQVISPFLGSSSVVLEALHCLSHQYKVL